LIGFGFSSKIYLRKAVVNIYDQISTNKRKTIVFMTIFLLLIIALGWMFSQIYDSPLILFLAIVLSLIQAYSSYFFGDKIALSISRAKLAEREKNKDIHRIVENLSITSGLPKPSIYIIEDQSPNAFATGRDPKHGSIAVTRGLLEILDKNELEGVIAHELSHIGNRDSLLMVVVVVLAGVVAIVSDLFFRIGFFGGFGDDDNSGGSGFGLIFGLVLAILAPIAAMLIQLAISRKREFMADATGALITRYPEGLARALKKISSYNRPLKFVNDATSMLYISNPRKKRSWLSALFDTHPPVEERIKALNAMAE